MNGEGVTRSFARFATEGQENCEYATHLPEEFSIS